MGIGIFTIQDYSENKLLKICKAQCLVCSKLSAVVTIVFNIITYFHYFLMHYLDFSLFYVCLFLLFDLAYLCLHRPSYESSVLCIYGWLLLQVKKLAHLNER